MQHHGFLTSFEGISGAGKSYLIHALKPLLAVSTTFVTEVVDREEIGLDREIIRLLAACGDRFFRGGRPRTETFLLLALKMFDYEARIEPSLARGHVVIEDRSIDTIAIYQALLLYPEEGLHRQLEVANEIYSLAARWRRVPDMTFLIEDSFETALLRVEQREGLRLAEDEVALLQQADQLYTLYACTHPRIITLKRQSLSTEELLQTIHQHLLQREKEM